MNMNVRNQFFVGRKTNVTGTPSQLQATGTVLYQGVTVLAESGNGADIYLGTFSGMNSASGFQLNPGTSMYVPIDDTSKVWLMSSSGTQTVSFLGA